MVAFKKLYFLTKFRVFVKDKMKVANVAARSLSTRCLSAVKDICWDIPSYLLLPEIKVSVLFTNHRCLTITRHLPGLRIFLLEDRIKNFELEIYILVTKRVVPRTMGYFITSAYFSSSIFPSQGLAREKNVVSA